MGRHSSIDTILKSINKMSAKDKKKLEKLLKAKSKKPKPKKKGKKELFTENNIPFAKLTPGEGSSRSRQTLNLFIKNGLRYSTNRKLTNILKFNPWRYDLPNEYVYNSMSNEFDKASDWVKSGTERELKPKFTDEYTLQDDVIVPNYSRGMISSAFGDVVESNQYEVKNKPGFQGLDLNRFRNFFSQKLKSGGAQRFYITARVTFDKPASPNTDKDDIHFSVQPIIINSMRSFDKLRKEITKNLENQIEEAQLKGSGFKLKNVNRLIINTLKYNPLNGGNSSYVKTPEKLINRICVINVENKNDAECFKWAVLSALHYDDVVCHRERVSKYKEYEKKYDWSMLSYPVNATGNSVKQFEEKNNISINILQYHTKTDKVSILNKSHLDRGTYTKDTKKIWILLMSNEYETLHHFVGINNMSRLMKQQVYGKGHQRKLYFCDNCLTPKTNQQALDNHAHICGSHEPTLVKMPKKGDVCKFTNFKNKIQLPGVMYCDFESTLLKVTDDMKETLKVTKEEGVRSVNYGDKFVDKCSEKHVPNSWTLYGTMLNGETRVETYIDTENRGDSVAKLIKTITEFEVWMEEGFQRHKDVSKPKAKWRREHPKQHSEYVKATHCHICEDMLKKDFKPEKEKITKQWDENHQDYIKALKRSELEQLTKPYTLEKVLVVKEKCWKETWKKVWDHDHCTGGYRGPAHSKCNLSAKDNKIPVFFHNLKGYDAHHIIKESSELYKLHHKYDPDCAKINIIPNNSEKYMMIGVDRIVFKDSFQFLSAGLAELAGNLPNEEKKHTIKHFKNKGYTDDQIHLLLEKGQYPYAWVDSHLKFRETKLPGIEHFYNDLTQDDCNEDDYEHAQTVWKELGCSTFLDYHKLYLECDVLLLADIFETFRSTALKSHKLDPARYVTLPGYSWDAMLCFCRMGDTKKKRIELELLTDIDMHIFFEEGKRGGISFISHRIGEANNPYMGKSVVDKGETRVAVYDRKKKTKYIMYVDMNNLYGKAMMEDLPIGDYKWMTENELSVFDEKKMEEDPKYGLKMLKELIKKDRGFHLKVDVDYPCELHDLHNLYPLLAEQMEIQPADYSDIMRKMKEASGGSDKPSPKLIPNLRNKKGYVIHSKALLQALELGLHLKKVHKGVSYKQEAWLKPYIEHNTKLRTEAKNDFEKDFFKLCNNAIFGKTMENVRNRIDYKICSTEKQIKRASSNPRFKRLNVFGEQCVGVQFEKVSVALNKPIPVGCSILDLSKTYMNDYHYNHILKLYDHTKVKLLFTDTDSFCYEIECEDFYKDMADNIDWYDTSNLPDDHPMFSIVSPAMREHLAKGKNKKVPGKMKCEANGEIITCFVGIKSKMYSFVIPETIRCLAKVRGGQCNHVHLEGSKHCEAHDEIGEQFKRKKKEKHKMTAKGVGKKPARKQLSHQDYLDCVKEHVTKYVTAKSIKGKNHQLFTVEETKKCLTPFDDKTCLNKDGISSLKWGHYKLSELPSEKYDGCTRDNLQKLLKERGLTQRGTKADCLKRLLEDDSK